jgi:hypothetical protein
MSDRSPTDMWRFVTGKEEAIASYLRSLVPALPSDIGQRVTRVASYFENLETQEGGRDSIAQQNALADVDLVAIVSPLLERACADQSEKAIGEVDLVSDLQIGVGRLLGCNSQRNNVVGLLTYPGLLLVGVIGVMLLFSQLVLPNFREIFDEFGIELPAPTKVVLTAGSVLEAMWPLALFVAFLAALPMVFDLCRCAGLAPGFVQWVDRKFSSKRSAMATWARHTALLLQSGLGEDLAVKTSLSAAKGWVNSGSWPWRFGFVEQVLKLEDTSAKIALLNHVADYYLARHRNSFQWWASFLPPIVVCLLGGLIAFVMLSIFMPLISIISGLSGGGF